ncbi:von Willebrand factor type A domain protein [uncultured archaeon]|nr:von Willebrand factor type A domain protein [uncultured archaeon]
MNAFKLRKGAFFSLDALVAVSIMLIAYALVIGISPAKTYPTSEYQQMHYLSDDAIQVFSNTKFSSINATIRDEIMSNNPEITNDDLNKSLVDIVGLLWGLDRAGYAANITRDFFNPLLLGMNYSLKITEYGTNTTIYSSTGNPSLQEKRRMHTSAFRMVSGYREKSPRTGFVARAYVTGATKKTQSYAYFGGYEGNGNITKIVALPSIYDTISETYIELDTPSNFTLYINGMYSGYYTANDTRPMYAKNWTVPAAYYSNFTKGSNNVTLAFSDINSAYVGGGFIRIKYNTSLMDTSDVKLNPDGNVTERYYFPGIDGIINIYSSFYVPGALRSLGIQLHYLSNYTVYLIIGNASVYQNSSNSSQAIYLNNTYLSSILNYSVFGTTMPLRFGTKNVSGMSDGSDVVLNTDLSGSMSTCDVNASTAGCSGTLHYRIDIAKQSDSDFVNTILGNPGQKAGLISYSSSTISSETVNLTDNNATLVNMINTYSAGGCTCISCGIQSATDMLASTLNITVLVANRSLWYYNDSFISGDPPLDLQGRDWTNINYSIGYGWATGNAHFGNASQLPFTTAVLQGAGTQNLADAYASSNNPATNYGSNTQLLVYGDGSKRTYIKFDLSWLPARQAINSAGLYLYESGAQVGDNVSVFHVNDTAWAGQAESTINWNNQPCGTNFDNGASCNLTAESKVQVNSQYAWFGWNVTQMVNRSYTKGDLNASMALNLSGSAGGKESFRSKEYWDPTKRPYLNITYQDIGTPVNPASNSIFFRKNFTISDMALAKKGILKIKSADAADVYLNGVLVFSDSTTSHNATYWNSISIINGRYFVKGDNIVAVKLYNKRGAPWFDLSLTALNDSRNKAMVIMTDGEANTLINSTSGCDTLVSVASNDSISRACSAYENYGIVSNTVGFGADAKNVTLIAIANCSHGAYYSSNNADELESIYRDIANSIIKYSTEAMYITGDISMAKLYTDSFIEYNYTPAADLTYGNITLTLESSTFGNSSGNSSVESPKNGSYYIYPGMDVIDAKATSYSSDYWTTMLQVKSDSDPGWSTVFNLSTFGTGYSTLGDPYTVNIPVPLIKPGQTNYARINTASNTTEPKGGSPDDKVIYSVRVRGSVEYNGTFSNLTAAQDDAKRRLNDTLGSIGITMDSVNTGTMDVGKIPWMWGPAIITLEVWKS